MTDRAPPLAGLTVSAVGPLLELGPELVVPVDEDVLALAVPDAPGLEPAPLVLVGFELPAQPQTAVQSATTVAATVSQARPQDLIASSSGSGAGARSAGAVHERAQCRSGTGLVPELKRRRRTPALELVQTLTGHPVPQPWSDFLHPPRVPRTPEMDISVGRTTRL